jgi:hypothetical protein
MVLVAAYGRAKSSVNSVVKNRSESRRALYSTKQRRVLSTSQIAKDRQGNKLQRSSCCKTKGFCRTKRVFAGERQFQLLTTQGVTSTAARRAPTKP